MKKSELIDYIQIATGVAVLLGLILVVYELRLAREIAQAQLTDQTFNNEFEDGRSRMGENLNEVIARACFEPESLSDADMIAMNAYYANLIMRTRRNQRLGEFFDEFDENVERSNNVALNALTGSKFGLIYFEQVLESSSYPPEVIETLRAAYDEIDPSTIDCASGYRAIRARLSAD